MAVFMHLVSLTLFMIIFLIGISVPPAFALRDFIPKSELSKLIPPSRESDWVSWDADSEFLPADQSGSAFATELARRMLSSSSMTSNPYSAQAYVNGDYEYNGYQQAWRYLGFMIDCDQVTSSSQRDLKSGSGDQTTGEGCSRYVLWAAYVDLEYEGGGIGEYQYWDRWTNQWDATSCNYASNNNNKNNNKNNNNNNNEGNSKRCAKMDCHLEDTHFSLLGIFKHKDYNEWMGQLFKHEGMCIWTQDEYSFMKQARKAWPQGCTLSGSYYKYGNNEMPLYYDLQPASQGDITVGLYTDTRCTKQYVRQGSNDPLTVENVLGNLLLNGGSGKSRDNNQDGDTTYSTLSDALTAWDSAFDIFKICQPCIAYDRFNVGWNNDDDASKGSSYYNYLNNNDNDGGGAYSDFDCYDDAGYTNVNQCMKFMAKTTMYAATYRDVALASEQGTIVDSPLTGISGETSSFVRAVQNTGTTTANSFLSLSFFVISCFTLLISLGWFAKVRGESSRDKRFHWAKESLVVT